MCTGTPDQLEKWRKSGGVAKAVVGPQSKPAAEDKSHMLEAAQALRKKQAGVAGPVTELLREAPDKPETDKTAPEAAKQSSKARQSKSQQGAKKAAAVIAVTAVIDKK